jgi:hypothetical protein
MFRPYTCAMQKSASAVPVFVISLAGLALAACGSASPSTSSPASSSAPATTAPTPTPTAAAVSIACPAASTVNAGLGVTVGAPNTIPATSLPAGDTGVTCEYISIAAKSVVIITLGTGPVSEPFIPLIETAEKKAAATQGETFTDTSVSGVGDQAVILSVTKTGVPKEDGILAVKGQTGLVVTVVPSASQSQLESFASQLLG